MSPTTQPIKIPFNPLNNPLPSPKKNTTGILPPTSARILASSWAWASFWPPASLVSPTRLFQEPTPTPSGQNSSTPITGGMSSNDLVTFWCFFQGKTQIEFCNPTKPLNNFVCRAVLILFSDLLQEVSTFTTPYQHMFLGISRVPHFLQLPLEWKSLVQWWYQRNAADASLVKKCLYKTISPNLKTPGLIEEDFSLTRVSLQVLQTRVLDFFVASSKWLASFDPVLPLNLTWKTKTETATLSIPFYV